MALKFETADSLNEYLSDPDSSNYIIKPILCLVLAKDGKRPLEVRSAALQHINLEDIGMTTSFGRSITWSNIQGELKAGIFKPYADSLINLANEDREPAIRGQAARKLSQLSRKLHQEDTQFGIPESLHLLQNLSWIVDLENNREDPDKDINVLAEKAQALMEYCLDPDVRENHYLGEERLDAAWQQHARLLVVFPAEAHYDEAEDFEKAIAQAEPYLRPVLSMAAAFDTFNSTDIRLSALGQLHLSEIGKVEEGRVCETIPNWLKQGMTLPYFDGLAGLAEEDEKAEIRGKAAMKFFYFARGLGEGESGHGLILELGLLDRLQSMFNKEAERRNPPVESMGKIAQALAGYAYLYAEAKGNFYEDEKMFGIYGNLVKRMTQEPKLIPAGLKFISNVLVSGEEDELFAGLREDSTFSLGTMLEMIELYENLGFNGEPLRYQCSRYFAEKLSKIQAIAEEAGDIIFHW
ncbi:MAG: hypothetical protein UV73_C0008G0027 [Candidatus Gottesmanbacteria bacterium GW2011_GWA2_43_14]|uniref:Uncharacterized protein n=1 Tax=Candidatus Gottesmanbacteria bacterium GW2011_GWA2_43_14 TaxID=1618443 RepID=A0A0G1DIT5_9BACT|nr:MAG: hypothetical protein UV73_C0008G0027 [Candidatus Gottesmanbacteria bacterium GW2011_GWA2_43_14]